MAAEAQKPERTTKTQNRKARPSRGVKALGPFSTREAAIQAIQSLGDDFVSLTVNWRPTSPSRAYSRTERVIASRPPNAIMKEQDGKLAPNVRLTEALREGQKLQGRFSSAEELFDALESGK